MTHDKEIEALIEAGEKATQGEWRKAEHDFGGVYFPNMIGGFTVHKDCSQHDNERFIVKAANARPALKALLAENKRYREALERIKNHFDQDGYGRDAWKALAIEMAEVADQALNPSEEK